MLFFRRAPCIMLSIWTVQALLQSIMLLSWLSRPGSAFVGFGTPKRRMHMNRFLSSPQQPVPHAHDMKLRDIQAELKSLGVYYKDCFDKESLVQRLVEARENPSAVVVNQEEDGFESSPASTSCSSGTSAVESPSGSPTTSSFDRVRALEEIRSKRVSELREECAARKIRWGNFVEKQDMVQAIVNHMAETHDFSTNMTPGQVTDLTGAQLQEELSAPHSTPLLLDIYATWCGPCQMFAGELRQSAAELQSRVRVGKLDSDKNPDWASRLGAAGLPTVILFDEHGKEIRRVEGAMRKEQVVEFVNSGLVHQR